MGAVVRDPVRRDEVLGSPAQVRLIDGAVAEPDGQRAARAEYGDTVVAGVGDGHLSRENPAAHGTGVYHVRRRGLRPCRDIRSVAHVARVRGVDGPHPKLVQDRSVSSSTKVALETPVSAYGSQPSDGAARISAMFS